MSSRFVAPTVSFIKAEATAVSRFIRHSLGDGGFLVRHPKLSRFLAQIPGASKFLHLPAIATTPHVAPVYNARARKPRLPGFRM